MAAGDAGPFPIKNKAYRVTVPVTDSAGEADWTFTVASSYVSKDGAASAATSGTATQVGGAGNMAAVYLDLTATEMNADTVLVEINFSANPTISIVLYPVALMEPSSVPQFGAGGAGIEEVLAWILAMNRNKMTQTSSTTTLRNDADSGNIATSAVSDSGSTFTKGEWA